MTNVEALSRTCGTAISATELAGLAELFFPLSVLRTSVLVLAPGMLDSADRFEADGVAFLVGESRQRVLLQFLVLVPSQEQAGF